MTFRSHFLAILALLCITSVPSIAKTTYDLAEFTSARTNVFAGPVVIDDETFFKVSLSPDFKIGGLELGFDLNIYTAEDLPNDLNTVVLRRIKYDYEEAAGIEAGRLQHVTLGHGLLMDNYDSGSFGSYEYSNEKAGVRGYIDYSPLRVEALYTASEVLGTRLVYTVEDSILLGAPLAFGATFIQDNNGINAISDGIRVSRPEKKSWSADVSVPIAGKFLTAYTEYAELLNNEEASGDPTGKGASLGLRGQIFDIFRYRTEYRSLGAGFIPAYFDQNYEATSVTNDPIQDKEIQGYLLGAGVDLGSQFKINATYEDYEDADPIVSAGVGWKAIAGVTGVVNYAESFGGNDSAVLSSDLLINSSGTLSYLVHFKRVYHPTGEETDSYNVGVQANLNNFFKLPFFGN